jgi:prepilin-type N-terminal cleavage/methylation domain-containing protein
VYPDEVMKALRPLNSAKGFTLIELLVVIAIFGLLAAMLLPILATINQREMKGRAKAQITALVAAINQYQATYGRLPASSAVRANAEAANYDYTYGDNSELMAILLDLETFRNGQPTINKGHIYNPQCQVMLEISSTSTTGAPGLGPDGVYRDPWGNPYVISLDLNGDGKCKDSVYCYQAVSQQNGQTGFNGLFNATDANGAGNNFLFSGKVMVWSIGPDKNVTRTTSANSRPNQDNIVSWK